MRPPDPPRPDAVESLVEEILLRRLRGENVKLDAILGEHANARLKAEVRSRLEEALRPTTARSEEASPLPIVPDFAILMELERDATGVAYLANQVSLGRPVTLKLLPGELAERPEAVARFRRVFQRLETLRHSAIVSTLAFGEEGGRLYYAIERMRGASLEQLLQAMREIAPQNRSSADLSEALRETAGVVGGDRDRGYFAAVARMFAELAEGLAHAHGRGVFHRDIRPGLIVVGEGCRPRLRDFELSHVLESGYVTRAELTGKATYRAPEAVVHGLARATAPSDVFSLGACLFETLTGFPPFRSETVPQLLDSMDQGTPEIERALQGKVPRDLGAICRRAIRPSPERRYATMDAFARDLRSFIESRPVSAGSPGFFWSLVLLARRNQITSAAVGLLLLVSLTFLLGFITKTVIVHFETRSATRRALTALEQGDLDGALEHAGVLRENRTATERLRRRVERRVGRLHAERAVEDARRALDDLASCLEELLVVRAERDALQAEARISFDTARANERLRDLRSRERALAESFEEHAGVAARHLERAENHAFTIGKDPYEPARELRARLAFERWREATSRGASAEAERFRRRVEQLDPTGIFTVQVLARGTLSTDVPEGATAHLFRYAPHAEVSPYARTDRLVPVPTDGVRTVGWTELVPELYPGDLCLRVTGRVELPDATELLPGDLIVDVGPRDEPLPLGLAERQRAWSRLRARLRAERSTPELRLVVSTSEGRREIRLEDASGLRIPTEVTAVPLIFASEAALPAGAVRARPLDRGSYLLVLRRPGRPDLRYPFVVGPGEDVALPLPVPGAAAPADADWIPPDDGSAGFWLERREVTWDRWRERMDGERGAGAPPDRAVAGISFEEVRGFLAALDRELEARGSPWRVDLPSSREWERAVRGADGRDAPWGSVPGIGLAARRVPVPDAPADPDEPIADEGPYGTRGLASGPSEWVRDVDPGRPDLRFYRGGVIRSDRRVPFRADDVGAARADDAVPFVGLRLVYRMREG